MVSISKPDQSRLHEIRKKLTLIGNKESAFTAVELLFYESISISRVYGESHEDNQLLASLKELELGQYRETKKYFRKSSQREQAIRKFIARLKILLNIS